MSEVQESTLTYNGVQYKMSELSDEVKARLSNLRHAEGELQRLNIQLAMFKTARDTYAQSLADVLPAVPPKKKTATKKVAAKKPAAKKSATKKPAAKKAVAKKPATKKAVAK